MTGRNYVRDGVPASLRQRDDVIEGKQFHDNCAVSASPLVAFNNVAPLLDSQILDWGRGLMSTASVGFCLPIFGVLSLPSSDFGSSLLWVASLVCLSVFLLPLEPSLVGFALLFSILTSVSGKMSEVLVRPFSMGVGVPSLPCTQLLKPTLTLLFCFGQLGRIIKNKRKGNGMIQEHHNLIRRGVMPLDVPPSQGLFVLNYTIDSPLVVC